MDKFKCRGMISGDWVYGYYMYDSHLDVHLINNGKGDIFEVDKDTVCLSFGKSDCNNVPIYEGDIIEFIFDGFLKKSEVVFNKYKGFTVTFDSFGGTYTMNLNDIFSKDRNITVIGHKYN